MTNISLAPMVVVIVGDFMNKKITSDSLLTDHRIKTFEMLVKISYKT